MKAARRWLLVGAVLLAAAFAWRWWFIESTWRATMARVAMARELLSQRPGTRPALWGELEAGRAFDDYDEALQLVRDAEPGLRAAVEDAAADPRDATDEHRAAAARLAAAIDRVRDGAHRSDPRRPLRFDVEAVPQVLLCLGLHRLAALRALELHQQGQATEAVKLVLDLMQSGKDWWQDPILIVSLVGAAQLGERLDLFLAHQDPEKDAPQATPALPLASLPPEALLLLRDALARLDTAALAGSAALRVRAEACFMHATLDRSGLALANVGAGLAAASWRYGFSARLMIADALDRSLAHADRLATDPDVPQPGVDPREPNLVLRLFAPNLESAQDQDLLTVARIRSLRLAVADAMGEEQSPADPFGGTIQKKTEGGRTVYWSRGKDRVDDGGDPHKDAVFLR